MFDLSTVTHRDTSEVSIHHPLTGVATGIVILVASPDGAVTRDAERALRERTITRLNLGHRSPATGAKEIEDDALDLLAARTVGWRGVSEKGRSVDYSPDSARRLYVSYPWLRRQVEAAFGERTRFFESSPTNSSATPDTTSD
ncbi:hypothetical protein [Myxococcus sp. CA039A]|uniref:hypothetical protein n=1 Tax=Myxococcus sp. CA039A TaxID=2741737 RepID=UPI00157B68F5|nr:hypothetical protein [Myxococcus sp. CA039A]NTX58151.1 hypothetical protein [Myxococcus sp. CA039A]